MTRQAGARSDRGTRHPHRQIVVAALTALALLLLTACSSTGENPPPLSSPTSSGLPTGSSTTLTTGPASAPPTAAPAGTTPVGAKWDWARFDAYQPYLAGLKGGYTYYEFVWCDIEPTPGQPDWSTIDQVVERTKSLDMTLLLKIRVGMCAATDGQPQFSRGANKTESGMPKNLGAYQAFITAVVKRYAPQGVTEFALENEVNSPSYWGGTPAQLKTLITAGAQAIRAGSPQAKVVDFGLSSTTYGYGIADRLLKAGNEQGAVDAWNSYNERRIGTRGNKIPRVTSAADLQAVLDSDQGRRNLTYLTMATDLARAKVVDVRQIHFYEKWSSVPDLMAYLAASTPPGTPIEAWEVGRFFRGSDTDDATTTGEVMQTMSGLLASGVRVAIWLPLAVNPDGRNPDEPRFGLLDPSGSVRPAGQMITDLATASRGATAVPVSKGGLTGVGYDGAGGSVLFVWGATAPVTVPPGTKAAGPGQAPRPVSGTVDAATAPVQLRTDTSVSAILASQK
ncbi:MAG: hypothetical protein ABI112_16570 [Terracoccus sp.]